MFIRTESFKEFTRYYPIITGIILIHIVLYILMVLPFFPGGLIFESFAGVNLYIMEGEFWRLVTPMFLHSGFPHLLFNSFSLVLFGPGLEHILGRKRFITLYLSTGILANVATLLLKPLTYTHVGSSGAIFGLFGIYLAMIFFRKEMLSRENTQVVLAIVVIGVIMTFVNANVNVTAHIFGLLSGLILGSFAIDRGRELTSSFQRVTKRTFTSHSHSSKKWSPTSIMLALLLILALIGLISR
ncbi:rhomboid family intramembrane serine protease [Robertmurraya korlensis]|uniref:rhomboid family intramembrane serine protease n=1 Tax=Robertmurraya korlensis TaxID=519977 RepID=UPI0008269346|nr:rhomboid family intramembrane serine protease [Robertmurraya korlensis]